MFEAVEQSCFEFRRAPGNSPAKPTRSTMGRNADCGKLPPGSRMRTKGDGAAKFLYHIEKAAIYIGQTLAPGEWIELETNPFGAYPTEAIAVSGKLRPPPTYLMPIR